MSTDQTTSDAKSPLTSEEKRALFDSYAALVAEEAKLEEAIAKLQPKKSEAVKAIVENVGKGPYDYRGSVVTVAQRGNTYYFRTRSAAKVEKIS